MIAIWEVLISAATVEIMLMTKGRSTIRRENRASPKRFCDFSPHPVAPFPAPIYI